MAHYPFQPIPITTALTGNTALAGEIQTGHISDIVFTAKFTYGSGGTTAKAYVQTTLDGGVSWIDIASFAFTTSSATKISALKAATAVTAAYAGTDGSLADDTIKFTPVIVYNPDGSPIRECF